MPDPRRTHPYLRVTCHWAPVQIEGTTPDGEEIYFRFRWGTASLAIDGTEVWSEKLSDDLDGSMDEDLALRLIASLLDFRAVRRDIIASRDDVDTDALKAELNAWMRKLEAPRPEDT